jgi:hypothetical protein
MALADGGRMSRSRRMSFFELLDRSATKWRRRFQQERCEMFFSYHATKGGNNLAVVSSMPQTEVRLLRKDLGESIRRPGRSLSPDQRPSLPVPASSADSRNCTAALDAAVMGVPRLLRGFSNAGDGAESSASQATGNALGMRRPVQWRRRIRTGLVPGARFVFDRLGQVDIVAVNRSWSFGRSLVLVLPHEAGSYHASRAFHASPMNASTNYASPTYIMPPKAVDI